LVVTNFLPLIIFVDLEVDFTIPEFPFDPEKEEKEEKLKKEI
jgi:hypothetical protein